jgi:tetratricopeptide (TPR) repeat protein
MPNNPNFSIEKVYSVYKKVKILKVQEKFSSALNLLEGILRSSKKKYYCECSKITSKILSICNYLFCNSSSKIQIMRRSEAAISTYLNLSSKHKLGVSEKLVRKMLISFNNCSCFHRLSGNYSLSFDYFQKALFLVKNSNFTEGPSFEMLSKVHLNLSSIFLQLKNFEDSINSSEQSLKALQKAILTRKCESTSEDQEKHQDTILGYVISFYCISLGQSGKKQSLKAREAISKAVDVGKNFFDLKNEVYEMVLNKYKDLETPSNNVELGRIKSVFHLALDQPFSSIKFLDPVKSQVAQSERKVPGRYYTRSQLAIKQKFLENHKNLNFISADEFFFQEISKSINIHSDLKHLKTTDSSDSKGWIRQENIEKRIISELRLKKKFRNTSLTSPIPTIHDKLKRLKLENDGQKNQVQNIVNSNQLSKEKILRHRNCSSSRNQ